MACIFHYMNDAQSHKSPKRYVEFLRIERGFWELVAITIIRAILRVPCYPYAAEGNGNG